MPNITEQYDVICYHSDDLIKMKDARNYRLVKDTPSTANIHWY